jgi:hypothetical protein
MAVLLDFHRCPSCDQYHDFCLPRDYIFDPGETYSFVCPVTGQTSKLKPVDALGSPVDECPPSAVVLRPLP